MTGKRASRRITVAHQLLDVGKSLHAFDFGDEQFLSRTVDETIREAEAAFAEDDFSRAEHLAKVVAYLVRREAPRFAANPARWVETWRELRS
jgi:hypothetical protein